jgi:DNA-binding CsgD family transcriptional regulator
MASERRGAVMYGRRRERRVLRELLDDARTGRGSALVLRAEAGNGKTTLLDYVQTIASGCRVVRVAGVESEMELAFAGLQQLCASISDRLDHLPGPQRDALRVAFGLLDAGAPDRYLVGLAVLSLLSEVAEERPFVCLVDDVQWLDRASAQSLAFVARRLVAESIALVFAVREPGDEQELAGLPQLVIEGLGYEDARLLLASAIPGRLDEQVRDRIIAETRGNPLALSELPRGLTLAELAGGFGIPDSRPLASHIEETFERRVKALPGETQRLLLVAALEPVGDAWMLWHAAEQLGIGTDAGAAAEQAGLIDLGTRVRFRHPLVRSAAARSASPGDRQVVHRALAEVTDPAIDPDRRAWHRARAASGPDEAVADELELSAGRAQSRGGLAAAAAFLERASELTPDPARRAERALAAARAKFEAGVPDAASELLAVAEKGPLDELQRAHLERLRAQIAFARRHSRDDPALLFGAAKHLEPLDAGLARETYLETMFAAIFAGRFSGDVGVREAAEAARTAPPGPDPPRVTDLLVDGLSVRFTQGYVAGVVPLRRALKALSLEERRDEGAAHWLWLGCQIAMDLWDDESWHELATRGIALAREAGALAVLPVAATYRAAVHIHAGEFSKAARLIEEGDAVTQLAGNASLRYTSIVLGGWRGREDELLGLIESEVEDATARGEGRVIALAEYASAVLYNSLGRYPAVLAAVRGVPEHDDLGLSAWAWTELIEAGVRSGKRKTASAIFEHLSERTQASGTEWALGIEARCRALLTEGDDAEVFYREATDRLARCRIAVNLAHAHLLYGEWLRRQKRRLDAREELRLAHEMFDGMGADAFAERARRELLATGETVRKRTADPLNELTPQEAQIARLARDGRTNPEISAELFLSPRTVEWHLRKVFMKLDISSRRGLLHALPDLD